MYSIRITVHNRGEMRRYTQSRKAEATVVWYPGRDHEIKTFWDGGSRDEWGEAEHSVPGAFVHTHLGAEINPMRMTVTVFPRYTFKPDRFLWRGGTFCGKPATVNLIHNNPSTVGLFLLKVDPDAGDDFERKWLKEAGYPLEQWHAYNKAYEGRGLDLLCKGEDGHQALKAEVARYVNQYGG